MVSIRDDENGVREDFTQDGTTDLKGRPVLRPETGRWKACYFMLGESYIFTLNIHSC